MKQLKVIYECMMGCLIVVGGGFIIYHLDTTNSAVSRIEKLGGRGSFRHRLGVNPLRNRQSQRNTGYGQ
ncbi:hypothetical protein F1728_24030 [Gimesia benthica]|uniref:Uncharacterized protein n=1 Tax=Gimesia benthica TaxID=2608982 RepID=A0A6I6AHJ9_9PLAN|nr:hypothetical protein [Gimesia benthica]QGQ25566.1 hypothetical protein F1728_24030 [Gimesia benthica]